MTTRTKEKTTTVNAERIIALERSLRKKKLKCISLERWIGPNAGILGGHMVTLPNKALLLPREVAKYYRVKPRTVYYWMEAGKLRYKKIGSRSKRIPREALDEFEKESEE